jgi:hypothetical protein
MSLRDDIERLLRERPIPAERIVSKMGKASLLAEPSDIDVIVSVAKLHDVYDPLIAYPAMALLPAWGTNGIHHLCEFATHGPHSDTAFSILAAICLGRVPTSADVHFLREHWDHLKKYKINPAIVPETVRRVRELVLEHLTDPETKSHLLNAISHQAMFPRDTNSDAERLDFLLEMLVDSRLLLNKDILQQFETLLDQGPEREEQLHQFLIEHPVLLDPFMTELRSKHELGDDFITDYVIRRTNNEYVVVEIENSTEPTI